MMTRKIGVIGHFGGGKEYFDGQTIKTKEVCKQLEKNGFQLYRLDTHGVARNPIKVYHGCKKLFKTCDALVLIVSDNGYKILTPILAHLNRRCHKKIINVAVGGAQYRLYSKNKLLLRSAQRFDKIFVQTKKIRTKYQKFGLSNVEVMYNFKDIKNINNRKKLDPNNFRVCTFSRVCKEKGIEDAIEAVKLANQKIGKNIFSLDIYGQIDQSYQGSFSELQKTFPDYVRYLGPVSSDQAPLTISRYDIMLFLTFWPNEGFPGVLIDAMAAATPVIASDWNYNAEVVENKKDSFIVRLHDCESVAEILIKCYQDYGAIEKMRKKYQQKVKQYSPEQMVKPLIKELL